MGPINSTAVQIYSFVIARIVLRFQRSHLKILRENIREGDVFEDVSEMRFRLGG